MVNLHYTQAMQPGVHFKSGSIVHIKPTYNSCKNANMATNGSENNTAYRNIENFLIDKAVEKGSVEMQDFMVYPNPAENRVTIKSNDGSIPEKIGFYNLQEK